MLCYVMLCYVMLCYVMLSAKKKPLEEGGRGGLTYEKERDARFNERARLI